MKKIILAALIGIALTASTIPQFFYYNEMRKAIAIREDRPGAIIIKDRTGNQVMSEVYPANSSRWVSVYRLAPGLYTATTTSGSTISFYRRP